jgi:non-ribosomal peptide synthetase component F
MGKGYPRDIMNDSLPPKPGLPPEQQAIRARWYHPTGTFIEFRREDLEQSIPQRFEQQVRKHPNRLAVKTKSEQLTYHELNRAANRIAQAILTQRGNRQETVALLFEQGASVIAAILGVLKAAKLNLPLDPSFSIARTIQILEDSQASLIITNNRNLSLCAKLAQAGCQVINVDDQKSSYSMESPGLFMSPNSFAHLFYTSGSTGKPKGVLQVHRNVIHDVATYTNSLYVCSQDRLALLYSHGISMGNAVIHTALLNGTALCLFDVKSEGVVDLAHWLNGCLG